MVPIPQTHAVKSDKEIKLRNMLVHTSFED